MLSCVSNPSYCAEFQFLFETSLYFGALFTAKAIIMEKPITYEAPKITKPLEALIVEKGTDVTLEVEFTGFPKPRVEWFRNGKEITNVEIITTETKTTLVIKKITKRSGGKYEVRVSNEGGEAKTSASLQVVGMLSFY